MLKFIDNEGQEHLVQAEFKYTNGVNGEKSISGEILTNDIVIHAIGRGWKLEFEDEFYCITYALPVDNGKDISVEFDAVQEFFFDFDKSVIHKTLNGSHTFEGYLSFIFDGSGYQYRNEVSVNAFEKENFGLKNRLTLFKDIIQSAGVEFAVSGKVVRILDEVGTDLSTIVRKGLNLEELKLEHNIGDFITYKKGYGAFFDEEDHSKGRLEVEYKSPLADVYGILEGDPVVDERFKVKGNLLSRITKEVENSYSISVQLQMADLSEAGYKVERPRAGDYIMAINDDIGFEEKVRIVSFETYYDTNSNVIDHTVTCNSLGMASIQSSNDATWKGNVEAELSGVKNQINYVLVSADGKNSIFYGLYGPDGKGEPKANKKGDLWYKPVGEETIVYIWDGQVWQEFMSTVDNKIIQETIDALEAESEQIKQDVDKALVDAEQAREDAFNSDKLAKEAKELAELANQGVILADEKSNQALADAEQARDDAFNAKGIADLSDEKSNQALADAQSAREDAFDSKAIADEAKLESSKALQKGNHNEVEISRLDGQLKVTNSKVEGNTTNLLNLKLESDKLSSSVSKTQYDLENFDNSNLLINSKGDNIDGYGIWGGSSLSIHSNAIYVKNNNSLGTFGVQTPKFLVERGKTYTIQADVSSYYNTRSLNYFHLLYSDGTSQQLDIFPVNASTADFNTFNVKMIPHKTDNVQLLFGVDIRLDPNKESTGFRIKKIKISSGRHDNKNWTPSNLDLITQHEFSTFEQTYQGFQSSVEGQFAVVKNDTQKVSDELSNTNDKLDNVDQKADNNANKLDNVDTELVTFKSQQTQMANQINSTVEEVANIKVGVMNRLKYSNQPHKMDFMAATGESGLLSMSDDLIDNTQTKKITKTSGNSTTWQYFGVRPSGIYKPLNFNLYKNWTITFRCYSNQDDVLTGVRVVDGDGKNLNVQFPAVTFKKGWNTITLQSTLVNENPEEKNIIYLTTNNWKKDTEVDIAWIVLSSGSLKLDNWSPAPEDLANKSEVTQLSDQITQTITKTTVLEGNLSQQQSQVNQLSDKLTVNISDTNANATKISQLELTTNSMSLTLASVQQENDRLNTKITSLEVNLNGFQATVTDDLNGVKSQQTQMANQISRTVEEVANIKVGVMNRLKYSNQPHKMDFIATAGEIGLLKKSDNLIDNIQTKKITKTGDNSTTWQYFGILATGIYKPLNFNLYKNWTITFRCYSNQDDVLTGVRVVDGDGNNLNVQFPSARFKKGWNTITLQSDLVNENPEDKNIIYLTTTSWKKDTEVDVAWIVLSSGSLKLDNWSPAPEDLANKSEVTQLSDQITQTITKTTVLEGNLSQQQSQVNQLSDKLTVNISDTNANATKISQLELTTNSMSLTLASVERENDRLNTKITSLEVNLNGFQATVTDDLNGVKGQQTLMSTQMNTTISKVDTIDGKVSRQQTEITQLSSSITLKADKNKLVSQINVSPESIRLDSKLIHLSGKSLIDEAVIKTAMIQDLAVSGAKIQNATIGNGKIINLDAAKITTGYLNANRIQARSITAEHLAANAITVGFNNSSTNVKLSGYNIEFLDGGKRSAQITSTGMEFWDGNVYVGWQGRTNKQYYPNIRGITNNLEYSGDFISWGYRRTSTATAFTSMLTLDPKGKFFDDGKKGIRVSNKIYFDGQIGCKGNATNALEFNTLRFNNYNYSALMSYTGNTAVAFGTDVLYLVSGNTYISVNDIIQVVTNLKGKNIAFNLRETSGGMSWNSIVA